MVFDPNYCPKVVDLVFAYDEFSDFFSGMKKDYLELGKEWGIDISLRFVPESEIQSARIWVKTSTLESITKDSVVIVHGKMKEEFLGLRAVKAIVECPDCMSLSETEATDARYIATYDSQYGKEVYTIFGDLSEGFPLDPKRQIGFFEIEQDDIAYPEKMLAQYFIKLAQMRD